MRWDIGGIETMSLRAVSYAFYTAISELYPILGRNHGDVLRKVVKLYRLTNVYCSIYLVDTLCRVYLADTLADTL